MRRKLLCLTGLILLAAAAPVGGQSLVYCPTALEERNQRCTRVGHEIARYRQQIETVEAQLRDPEIVLAAVQKNPAETLGDYRARVKLQQGVATQETNSWLPVRGHYYNAAQGRMYVAMRRQDYWHYIWEGLAFDPDLAAATFIRREQGSRSQKAYQLDNPESAINQQRYQLETLMAFERECCPAMNPENTVFPLAPSLPEGRATEESPLPGDPGRQ
jgi:hypothetical protein